MNYRDALSMYKQAGSILEPADDNITNRFEALRDRNMQAGAGALGGVSVIF